MNEILRRDQNHITVLGGVTNDADQDITMLRVDPVSKRLLVSASISGLVVTSLNGLTGDITLAAGTNINLGIVGNTITINATDTDTGITQLTGDVTAGPGSGSQVATLATVNSNVGTFGSATQSPQLTVNGKGLITAVSNVTITPAASSITGGQALSRTNDTNVTLTLGGSPTTSLLAATSLTLGWSGQLAISRGGTGQSTANAAFNALAPSQTGNSGKYLTTDGSNTSWGTVNATSSIITNDTTTNAVMYPTWVTTTSGNLPLKVSSGLLGFNPNAVTGANLRIGSTTDSGMNNLYVYAPSGPTFQVQSGASGDHALRFIVDDTNSRVGMFSVASGTPYKFVITRGSTNKVVIDDPGVAIGDFTPTSKFQVGESDSDLDLSVSNNNVKMGDVSTAHNGTLLGISDADLTAFYDPGPSGAGYFVIGGQAPTSVSGLLEVNSTTKGFLEPRMNTTQRDAITVDPSLDIGLMIYNTTTLFPNVYNGETWASIPITQGNNRLTSRTGAVANVLTYAVPANADGSFEVSANVLVNTATLHNFTVTCTYTDEGGTSRTQTMPFVNLAGTVLTAIVNAAGAVPYEGVPIHIRAQTGTSIVIATTGTFTTVNYNVEANIRQID